LRSTTIGTALLSVSIVFAFISVLFSNISYVVVAIVFVSCYVFAYREFSYELASTDLQIERAILDDMVFANEPVAVTVEVLNRHSTTVRGTFIDQIPEDCTIASGSNSATIALPPRSVLKLSYTMVPSKRGPHTIKGMAIDRTDAHELFTEHQVIEQKSDLTVHTQKASLDTARKMAGREHLEFSGVGRSPAVVLRELEFDGIRDYVPGDRPRDIHWKLLAKLGRLMTKTYRKEGAVQTMVFVDCSSSMRLKTHKIAKVDHAVDLSMQLSNVLISSYHPTGVAVFDELRVIDKVVPALGKRQFERVVKVLRNAPGAMDIVDRRKGTENRKDARPVISTNGRSGTSSAKSEDFMTALQGLSTAKARSRLGYGLDGGIKELIAGGRGREQMFIVVTDLMSSRNAVLLSAKLCKATNNRMLVVGMFDDWYGPDLESFEAQTIERMYGDLGDSIKLEGSIRGLGASFIRVGPADTAAGIARAIRRGRT
jgi:uncharacterized protein (DUF58 family)